MKQQVWRFLGLTGYHSYSGLFQSSSLSDRPDKKVGTEPQSCGHPSVMRHLKPWNKACVLDQCWWALILARLLCCIRQRCGSCPKPIWWRAPYWLQEQKAVAERKGLFNSHTVGSCGFKIYLQRRQFITQTDHHLLDWLKFLKEENPWLCRDCNRTGIQNINPDALSREISDFIAGGIMECDGSRELITAPTLNWTNIHWDLGTINNACCLPLCIKLGHVLENDIVWIDGRGCYWGYHPVSNRSLSQGSYQ